MHEDQMRKKYA